MWTSVLTVFMGAIPVLALNLEYLDPKKLQTVTSTEVQKDSALRIIRQYSKNVAVEVNHQFQNNKDYFTLRTVNEFLYINASTGVAAVWGFNYYLKKYCKSQIEWQTENVNIPHPLPPVNETVVANDRFRYYQDTCTVSYSFIWWNVREWMKQVTWMALNGINLTLAPVAQEAIWQRIYRSVGMTQEEIDKHFTGPAFLCWLRMGNLRGWGGPLPQSWHELQFRIQHQVINTLLNLGIAPILPAFNGHVPEVFEILFPNHLFYKVKPWRNFSSDYSSGLFVRPIDSLFNIIGSMFLNEMGRIPGCHIYTSEPFNEVDLPDFSTKLAAMTARNIFKTLFKFDKSAVWLLRNKPFISRPDDWPKSKVYAFLRAVPDGRVLILDSQADISPKYDTYDMYFGQPFIWCMQHNFGGTLGMHGNMATLNKDVYEVRSRVNSSMIGIGLTPEGINQNYVVYDLMLESAWRPSPIQDLDAWVADYAERRYGCNNTAEAWKYLLKSVYSYSLDSTYKVTVTQKPSFDYSPWAWYKSIDLFNAFRSLISVNNTQCDSKGYRYDVVDVTRQVLQYKIEQLFIRLANKRATIRESDAEVQTFLDAFDDMARILATDINFLAVSWFTQAKALGNNSEEADLYEYNAWNQITLWGPNGELNDYAGKQWSEMITYYYRPGWAKFLRANAIASDRNETPKALRKRSIHKQKGPIEEARRLYHKWISLPSSNNVHNSTAPSHDQIMTTSLVNNEDKMLVVTAVSRNQDTPTTEAESGIKIPVVTAASRIQFTTATAGAFSDVNTRSAATTSGNQATSEANSGDEAWFITAPSNNQVTTTTEAESDDETHIATDENGDRITTTTEVDADDESHVVTTTIEPDHDYETRIITDENGDLVTTTTEAESEDDTRVITAENGDQVKTTTEADSDDKTHVVTDEKGDPITTTTESDSDDETRMVTNANSDKVTTNEENSDNEVSVVTVANPGQVTAVTEATSDHETPISTAVNLEVTPTIKAYSHDERLVKAQKSSRFTTASETNSAIATSAAHVTTTTNVYSHDKKSVGTAKSGNQTHDFKKQVFTVASRDQVFTRAESDDKEQVVTTASGDEITSGADSDIEKHKPLQVPAARGDKITTGMDYDDKKQVVNQVTTAANSDDKKQVVTSASVNQLTTRVDSDVKKHDLIAASGGQVTTEANSDDKNQIDTDESRDRVTVTEANSDLKPSVVTDASRIVRSTRKEDPHDKRLVIATHGLVITTEESSNISQLFDYEGVFDGDTFYET